jgi:hypothetical protein
MRRSTGDSIMKDPDVVTKLYEMKEDDATKAAEAFDMVGDLKHMFDICHSMRYWGGFKRLLNWTMVLFILAVIGRASCVCEFCPLIENIRFPKRAKDYDADGMPKFIEIGFHDWKARQSKYKGQLYYVFLRRNYLDQRVCPVFWLLCYLRYDGRTTGPIFVRKSQTFCKMVKRLFRMSGLPRCSSHSFRRTAFQWAARCGGELMAIKLLARHTYNSNCFVVYMQEGYKITYDFDEDEEQDPIFTFWVWEPATPNQQPFAQDFSGGRGFEYTRGGSSRKRACL